MKQMAGFNPASSPRRPITLPDGVSEREALFMLAQLVRVKRAGFGRLVVAISDGRVVDIEVIEKVDRNVLKTF